MMLINQDSVIQIESGGFIGKIYHMIDRQVPDGECFKFCIPGLDSDPIFMVKIAQAGGKLTAARARACDDNYGIAGGDVLICTISLIAYNQVNISRISFCRIMQIYLDPS